MSRERLRITNHGDLGQTTRIEVVSVTKTADGETTEVLYDISRFIRAADVHLAAGEANTVKLDALLVGCEIDARLDDLALKHVFPTMRGRMIWAIKKRWWGVRRKQVDVTRFGNKTRRYLPGL